MELRCRWKDSTDKWLGNHKFEHNVINLSLWWFKNNPFGIDIAIAVGIEINAMAVFVDFDSDPDSDFDGYSQYENFLS